MKKRYITLLFVCSLFTLLPSNAIAQTPTISADGIRNGASYAIAGLPNAPVAQGSIFVVFGQNMGPAVLVQVSSFPLPTTAGLAGTSIRITVGGVTVDAIMLYTSAGQVAGVVPSSTPEGTGTLTVTYNGATSAPAPITVTRSSFGIFTLNQAGTGPAVIQNVNSETDRPFNGVTEPARPGQVMILWGTGIGPISGDEANGAGFGMNMPGINLKVWVGSLEAVVQYQGRSGCCVGVDQIVFVVPEGVNGCYVPVSVQIDNIVSNFGTIAVDSSGSTCSDSFGLSRSDLETAETTGTLRVGDIGLTRITTLFEVPGQGTFNSTIDTGYADFFSFTHDQLTRSQGISGFPSLGGCFVFPFSSGSEAVDPIKPTYLDAGSVINVTGPNGAAQLAKFSQGVYIATLGQSFPGIGGSLFLDPGNYTFNNGGGGSDVGAFQASHNHAFNFIWSNEAGITSVNRSQHLLITWTGGGPGGYVLIFGTSTDVTDTSGAGFYCLADAAPGSFTVPSNVLLALPPSGSDQGIPFGALAVGTSSAPTPFEAPGLDTGYAHSTAFTLKPLGYN